MFAIYGARDLGADSWSSPRIARPSSALAPPLETLSRMNRSGLAWGPVEQALFEPTPKRRYLAIPRIARDPINSHLAKRVIRWQMKQLVQWNEGQAYTFDGATFIKMLDDALATARPRTE